MKQLSYISFVFLVAFQFAEDCSAQWSNSSLQNTPVCTSTGKQIDLRIAEDGNEGAYITWKDYRVGVPDIYIQHLNKYGVPQWDTAGVALCTNSADQSTPAIVSDMSGGVIVAWSDWRSSIERDIYAQRIDSNGIVQWTVDGEIVTNKTNREHNEKIISDNAGGAIVVWEQQSLGQWDIWAQRINHNGVAQWANGGIALCTVNANRLNPKVQPDGRGGAYVTWQDFRNGIDYNIYAQHVSTNGNLQWGASALPICMALDAQTDPKMNPDTLTGGIYIAWVDNRDSIDYDIYAQRIDSAGNVMWATDGVPVCVVSGNQTAHDLLSKGSMSGLIVTWKDNRNGQYDIYAQKLSPSGFAQWATNGIVVCNSVRDQLNPNIISDHAGGAIITWQDSTLQDWNIKGQRISSNGIALWQPNGVDICTADGAQTSPKNVSDARGGSIFAWQDKRTGIADIYAHHLFANGKTYNDVGIHSLSSIDNFTFSPNPCNTYFMVSTAQHTIFEISIINSVGEVLEVFVPDNKNAIVSTLNYKAGLYIISLKTTDGIIRKKLMVE